ncbi:MAG TPA: M48 family metallopeptidase [Verrucomicrobiae bacterium]|nr:M48 family metallopeptidase [Verrucomicrobiae bacterium]
MRSLCAAILSIALAAGAYASDQKNKKDDPNQIGDRDVGKCLNFYSLDKEMQWGKRLADEVAREARMDDDPILGEFVNRVGQNLARNSDAKVPFTFKVIDSDELNAFSLPGGYVFVYTGLIKLASEEDEFAGALAHEIAHVAARHMTCRASEQQLARAAGIVPSILLGGLGGLAVRQATDAAIPATFRTFSRHDELEADYLGVQYMYAAGYDPTGAVSIFEKLDALQKTKPGAVARVLATHPMTGDRINKAEEEIEKILPAKAEYVVSTSEYRDVRERLIARDAGRKSDNNDGKPVLRRRPGDGKVDDPDAPPDDRPTLKRHDLFE